MNYQRKENKTEKATLVVFEWWDFGEFCFLYFYSSVFSKFLYNVCGIIRCLGEKKEQMKSIHWAQENFWGQKA